MFCLDSKIIYGGAEKIITIDNKFTLNLRIGALLFLKQKIMYNFRKIWLTSDSKKMDKSKQSTEYS
jgi:hypothetical protein